MRLQLGSGRSKKDTLGEGLRDRAAKKLRAPTVTEFGEYLSSIVPDDPTPRPEAMNSTEARLRSEYEELGGTAGS